MPLFKKSSNDSASDAPGTAARAFDLATAEPGDQDDVAVLRAILGHYPPGHKLRLGERTRCPKCATESLVNLNARSSEPTHRCGTCRISWQVTERALGIIAGEIDHGEQELERVRARLAGHRAMQLLLVEDDPNDAKLLRKILEPVVPDVVEIFHTDNLHDAMLNARLGFDATLIDVNLPDSQGMDTVRRFHAECHGLPVCFATGDPATAEELRDKGVAVMPKYDLERMIRRHHQGTADVLGLLVDAIAASERTRAAEA